MIYSCKKCLTTFEKEIKKCPSCNGEVKQILTEEYKKDKKINYVCPYCNHNFPFDFDICPKCGKKSIRCSYCGFIIDENFRICPGCGIKIVKK